MKLQTVKMAGLALLVSVVLLAAAPRLALAGAGPYPKDMFDRGSVVGKAKGQKAGGQPDPVPGLVNPDIPGLGPQSASMEDLVLPFGYPLESYPVETSDGFVLRVYRIPHGVKNSTGSGPKPVVLLHHGVTLASSSFAVMEPEDSMAFYLADAGFDVWMPNTRGNTYSKGNRRYKNTQQGYWDNSMDELALIDLPTQLDFILEKSGQKQAALIGHSQGCSLASMLLAARPAYIDKIWLLMYMGPVTHSEYIQTPFLKNAAKTDSANVMLGFAGIGQFIPNTATTSLANGCKIPAKTEWCFDFINFMFYGPSQYISYYDFVRFSATWPATVGTRNLVHWSQMYHTRNGIYMYDYGTNCTSQDLMEHPYAQSCNQMFYGGTSPIQYDLGKIHSGLKVAILAGTADLMATPEDIAELRRSWKATEVAYINYPNVAHMDFVWARRPIMKNDIIRILWDNAPRALRRLLSRKASL